jgi:hypothetical protein
MIAAIVLITWGFSSPVLTFERFPGEKAGDGSTPENVWKLVHTLIESVQDTLY